MENVPSSGIKKEYDGLWRYLEQGENERKTYRSKYNKRVREVASFAIDFLALFCEKQDDQEVLKVLSDQNLKPLIHAFLTSARKIQEAATERKKEANDTRIRREFQIAVMFMEKGIAKCLQQVQGPYRQSTENDALSLVSRLKWSTTGEEGANLYEI